MEAHGFALAKGSFRDALCLRYGWTPPHLPLQCPCGKPFDTDHALSCGTGGYSIMRHNEIRDFTASLLDEVCGDVQIEPTLIPLSGEAQLGKSANTSSEARLDVSARGFWGDRFARTMFDVRIFHPNAPSVRTVPVNSLYVRHEKEKRRRYEQRVKDVEGATFVPLVLSTAGGMGRSSSVTFKRIAALLAEKTGLSYAATINVVRCRLSFALLRSAITALRGSRRRAPTSTSFQPALAFAEARVPHWPLTIFFSLSSSLKQSMPTHEFIRLHGLCSHILNSLRHCLLQVCFIAIHPLVQLVLHLISSFLFFLSFFFTFDVIIFIWI